MQKLISKYAVAAHLAVLAVSPLLLFPFFKSSAIADAILYLTLFALVWVIMEPSRRKGEHLHNSRERAAGEIFRDPILWVMLFFVFVAWVRWLNGGIKLAFDAENFQWYAKEASLPFLPASALDVGKVEFAAALASLVIIIGLRHSVGRSARVAFLFSGAFLAAIAAVVAIKNIDFGDKRLLVSLGCDYLSPSFIGTVFGLWTLAGIVALSGAIADEWKGFGFVFVFAFAIGGTAVGLVAFAPAAIISLFAFAAVLTVLFSLFWIIGQKKGIGGGKFFGIITLSIAFGVILALALDSGNFLTERFDPFRKLADFDTFDQFEFFPAAFIKERRLLSSIAGRVFVDNIWIGSGVGTFSLDVRFYAKDVDWAIISTTRSNAMNGWLNLVAERGLVGIVALVAPAIMLLVSFVMKIPGAVAKTVFMPGCFLAFSALITMTIATFFDTSLFRPSAIMAMAGFLAVLTASIPPLAKETISKSQSGEADISGIHDDKNPKLEQ